MRVPSPRTKKRSRVGVNMFVRWTCIYVVVPKPMRYTSQRRPCTVSWRTLATTDRPRAGRLRVCQRQNKKNNIPVCFCVGTTRHAVSDDIISIQRANTSTLPTARDIDGLDSHGTKSVCGVTRLRVRWKAREREWEREFANNQIGDCRRELW